MATRSEIRRVLGVLISYYAYWGKERTDEQVELTFAIYEHLLADLTAEVLEGAVIAHISESKFFPTVSELRDQAATLTSPPPLSALEAWEDRKNPITEKVRKLLPDYNDPMITLKEQAVIKSLFIKTYNEIRAREHQERRRLPEMKTLRQKVLTQFK